jgi:dTDP-4-amino-4,6-dideoxygalactose transaminase
MPVHVFGNPCDEKKITRLARRHGLKVIYDAAHAFGVRVRGKSIARWGDASMFSFHATKLFTTVEGGCLTFGDARLARRIYLLKNFGIENEEEVSIPGVNGKMNELQAAIGLTNLPLIDRAIARGKTIAGWYDDMLASLPGVTAPVRPAGVRQNFSYYPIRITAKHFGSSRDELVAWLRRYNVWPRKYFYPLASHFACYRHLPSAASRRLPVAESVAREILCLPIYRDLTKPQVRKICRLIASAGRRA